MGLTTTLTWSPRGAMKLICPTLRRGCVVTTNTTTKRSATAGTHPNLHSQSHFRVQPFTLRLRRKSGYAQGERENSLLPPPTVRAERSESAVEARTCKLPRGLQLDLSDCKPLRNGKQTVTFRPPPNALDRQGVAGRR